MSRPVRRRPGGVRGGRTIAVPKTVITARDIMRRHLHEERWFMKELGQFWGIKPDTVKFVFWKKTPLPPQYVDAFIEALELDEFDAAELRVQGAIEAGWQLHHLKELIEP